jgi:hypothetical protein
MPRAEANRQNLVTLLFEASSNTFPASGNRNCELQVRPTTWSIDLLLKAVVLKNQSPSEATEILITISPCAWASSILSMRSGGVLFVLRDIQVTRNKYKITIIHKARRTRMTSFRMMQRIHTLTVKTTRKKLLKKL